MRQHLLGSAQYVRRACVHLMGQRNDWAAKQNGTRGQGRGGERASTEGDRREGDGVKEAGRRRGELERLAVAFRHLSMSSLRSSARQMQAIRVEAQCITGGISTAAA